MNIPYNAYMEPVKEFIALYCIKFAYGYMKSLYYEHTFGPLEVYNKHNLLYHSQRHSSQQNEVLAEFKYYTYCRYTLRSRDNPKLCYRLLNRF